MDEATSKLLHDATRAWPVVGRDLELRAIEHGVASGGGAFVTGPAGVGKTRLLQEVAAAKREAGFDVVEITGADAAAAIPLAPLLQLVDFESEGDVARLVLRELGRRSRQAAVLLVVDDAHHLDDASAAIVHQIARSKLALLLVATRSGEATEFPIRALWKDRLLDRFDVGPLDRASTVTLVERVLGATSSQVGEWLWAYSRGHPLFLRELIIGAAAAGALARSNGVVDQVDHVDLPTRLLDLVDAHLSLIDAEIVESLAAVALGQPAPIPVIQAVQGSRSIDDLDHRGLAAVSGETVTVVHPLYGEAALRRIGSDSLNELQVRLAKAFQAQPGFDHQAAGLFLDAGVMPDVATLAEALTLALRLRQGPLAERFALAMLEQRPTARTRGQLASALAIQHRLAEADAQYRQAVAEADETERAALWLEWIRSTFEYSQDPGIAKAHAAEAMESLDGGDHQFASALWLRSRMFVEPFQPVFDALVALSRTPDLDPRASAIVDLDIATTAWQLGRPSEGLEAAERGLRRGDADPVNEARLKQTRTTLMVWGRSLIEAARAAEDFAAEAKRQTDLDTDVLVASSRALIEARAGRAALAVDAAITCLKVAERAADRRIRPLILGELCLAHSALSGHEAETSETLTQIEHLPDGARINAEILESIARSRVAYRQGDLAAAESHLRSGLDRSQWRGSRTHGLLCLWELTVLNGATAAVVEHLDEMASVAGPGLARLYADEARARLHGDGHALDSISTRAADYGAVALAWEAAAAAQQAHRSHGDLGAALASEMRVHALGAELPGQLSPLVAGMEPVLTTREQEVVEAVTAGATNPQVAEQLYLSPRTVQRHLERIYRKLGIHDRQTLAAIVSPQR